MPEKVPDTKNRGSGKTAAEIVYNQADHTKENMGLTINAKRDVKKLNRVFHIPFFRVIFYDK